MTAQKSITTQTPLQALAAQLSALQPRQLLSLGSPTAEALAALQAGMQINARHDVRSVDDLAHEPRYDCALLADFLEHLSRADGIAVLGRLRNLHAAQLLVFFDHTSSRERWTLDDFISLGFRHDATLQSKTDDGHARQLSLYSYDIANYNHVRDWNNPRFWANPEMWGKYFW